jgi:agmatinase
MDQNRIFGDSGGTIPARDGSRIAVLPVPYDKTSTWIKGADKGPLAIIEASHQLETLDIETGMELSKEGIFVCPPVEADMPPEEMARRVEESVSKLLKEGKFVVVLGGEHSVSIGAIKAHSLKFKGLSVLQLDAHADLREEYEGSRFNHACVTARVKEDVPVVQAGIRSMSAEEKGKIDKDSVFYARDIITGGGGWIEDVTDKLSENVYVTIDLDVFDPSVMPSTGTPQPGGLDWYAVTGLLREVSAKKNIVGFDVVELCPMEGNKAPDLLAAKLVYKLLCYIFARR